MYHKAIIFDFFYLVLTFSILNIIPATTNGQVNLVPNPGFEDHTNCPNSEGQINYATHWYNPCNWNPDYYHSCGSWPFIPPYCTGSFQYPRTGVAQAGISAWKPSNFREYIAVTLENQLITGRQYLMGFYINYSGSSHAIDLIGARLNVDSTICSTSVPIVSLLNYIPQVCNTKGIVLNDTVNWVLISGSFYAQGGEKYLLIGDFYPDNENTIQPFIPNFGNTISYYFIDDVFLYEVDSSSGISEQEIAIQQCILSPNPTQDVIRLDFPLNLTRDCQFQVFDLPGNLVFSSSLSAGRNSYSFSLGSLGTGMYLYTINNGSRVMKTGKIIRN